MDFCRSKPSYLAIVWIFSTPHLPSTSSLNATSKPLFSPRPPSSAYQLALLHPSPSPAPRHHFRLKPSAVKLIDAFSANWLLSLVRDRVEPCVVGGACHAGKAETVRWRMERVRMWRMWSVRADGVVRWVGVVDGGEGSVVTV